MPEQTPWATAKLSEIAQIYAGGTPPRDNKRFWGGSIPWLTPGELSGEGARIISSTAEYITSAGLRNSGAVLLPSGTLLVTTRATLGACTIAGTEMATNQGFKNLVFDREIADPTFYYYFFRTLKRTLERRASGTTFLEISAGDLGNLPVPTPPLAEQRRIVEALCCVSESEQAIEASIVKLNIVQKARLEACTAPGDGRLGPLKDRLLRIEAGKSPDLPNTPAAPGEWGVLKVSAIHRDGFRPNENKIAVSPADVNQRYEVHCGDLLMSRANTPDLVGSACIATKSSARLLLSDKTLRLIEEPQLADRDYINLCLASTAVRRQIEHLASGSSRSMQNISQRAVESLVVYWPDLAQQRRIVNEFSSISEQIRQGQQEVLKLRKLRAGLTDDLLSGRVRVGDVA
ncbi:restriction endonuclease subunit S [Streptomyces sp. NPDC007083]|uniref:restriction endonuclease subunit S n=1 Tax=Streptomyces sp. NPDC007083 TaxID=3156913 RepID=UPI0033EE67BD